MRLICRRIYICIMLLSIVTVRPARFTSADATTKKGSGSKITLGDVAIFQSLRKRGAVGTIWIVACEVAQNKEGSTLGTDFCKQLAINAGCDVVAADKTQKVDFIFNNFRHPYGHIDDFEGIAYRFSPGGSVEVWSRED